MVAGEGYVIGFDFGLKHLGIAVGQTVTGTASGLSTLKARNGKPNWSEIDELLVQYRPIAIVVGLPLNMDGSDSHISQRASTFAQRIARHTHLPTYLADERLSSWAAKDDDLLTGDIHARSACLIAETFLNDFSVCLPVKTKLHHPI